MLARGKIIYIATIMDTNRDLAHKSQNEDKFPIFFFGLELLNEAEKEKKNGEGDSASAPSRFALLSEGEMQQIYLQLTNSYFAKYFAYREQSLLILLSVLLSDLMHNSTGYVIKQLVHAYLCTIELCSTWEVSVIALGKSYASFVLSKLPTCSITR